MDFNPEKLSKHAFNNTIKTYWQPFSILICNSKQNGELHNPKYNFIDMTIHCGISYPKA